MSTLTALISCRGVRTLSPDYYQAPWTLVKKQGGWRKRGPLWMEKWKWPGQNREFGELNPKFQGLNPPELHKYTRVHPTGYVDKATGNFVEVPDMKAELVVPILEGFDLKPYVSYKTDVEIDKKITEQENKDKMTESSSSSSKLKNREKYLKEIERWPPEKVTPKFLFDHFYAPKIKEAVRNRAREEFTHERIE